MQFDRQYRLMAGAAGGQGFEVGDTTAEQPTALHIDFKCIKSDTETPNTANISIWNLTNSQLAILDRSDCVIALRAGYDNHMPMIFIGNKTRASTEIAGGDRETNIEVVDGGACLRTTCSLSFSGRVAGRTIAQRIADEMNVALSLSHNVAFHAFDNFSFIGYARCALDKICRTSGAQWSVQDGVLNIKMQGGTMNTIANVLAPDSGMIGSPVRVTIPDDGYGNEASGWEVRTLLNGSLKVNDFVKVESRRFRGYCRIHSIEYSGSNLGGSWQSIFTLVDA